MATALNLEYSSDAYSIYDISINDDHIRTTVTRVGWIVDDWIKEIERIHRRRLNKLIVGLDIEWRPNFGHYKNRVAILQLCVGRRCLIFQLIHASQIPVSLVHFLRVEFYTFVGAGIQGDVNKLLRDYNLEVCNVADLRNRAVTAYGENRLKNAGLKSLAQEVLGIEIEKPKKVTLSRWDQYFLSQAQVQYACLDAFLSFEIGRVLMSNNER